MAQRREVCQSENLCQVKNRKMDLNHKLIQSLYNLVLILQLFSIQLTHVVTQQTNTPKRLKTAELNPITTFDLEPFQVTDLYLKRINGKDMKENIRKYRERKRPELRKTGHGETGVWKTRKLHEGDQALEELSGILSPIIDIKNQIKKLKMVAELLENLKTKLRELEASITFEPFEKVLKYLEKNSGNKPKVAEGPTSRGINNTTYNNQYQIENIFIINRLSKENNSETDVESFNELTARKMKELLENYLKEDGIPRGDAPAVTQLPLDMDLLKLLQGDFLSAFQLKDLTSERLDRISKIIDFVERYHGSVSDMYVGAKRKVIAERSQDVYESDEDTVM